MREVGVGNYALQEEIKNTVDPLFLLNPHLSVVKPDWIKNARRKSKMLNSLMQKLKF